MNVERMLYLADQLENPTNPKLRMISFNMCDYSSGTGEVGQAITCGTAACIGGHACILFGDLFSNPITGLGFISGPESRMILGLTLKQARHLFHNADGYINPDKCLHDITREEAVAAIRRMVKEHVDETIARMEPGVGVEHALCY